MGRLKVDTKRMAAISIQLISIIHVICNAKGYDFKEILNKYTNITDEELDLIYSTKTKGVSNGN